MDIFIYSLSILVVVASFWSLIPYNAWWVRGADFPRLQLLVLGIGCLVVLLWRGQFDGVNGLLLAALILALIYQIKMVIPYTPLYPTQVKKVAPSQQDSNRQLSLLVSNVLTSNPHHDRLITQITQCHPDVILTLETDDAWERSLTAIETEYPYSIKVPLDNLYGMHLYSRLPIIAQEIKFLLSEHIPSIHAKIRLPCGKPVMLHCLHPEPPSPTEADESTLRDAELLMVGQVVKDAPHSCIVMGDLNDVAWSRTTQLFGRISGLLDPRVGRYFVNTFHADFWCLRWSLDHVFHSSDFALVEMKRLPHIGSDHFPVYTVLQYDGNFEEYHDEPIKKTGDTQLASQKIQEGLQKAKEEGVETTDTL